MTDFVLNFAEVMRFILIFFFFLYRNVQLLQNSLLVTLFFLSQLPPHLCQTPISCICVGPFLRSLFCPIGLLLCVLLHQNHTGLITAAPE